MTYVGVQMLYSRRIVPPPAVHLDFGHSQRWLPENACQKRQMLAGFRGTAGDARNASDYALGELLLAKMTALSLRSPVDVELGEKTSDCATWSLRLNDPRA